MITTFLLIIVFFIISKYLVTWINYYRTGDSNENSNNFWMFTYDFKSKKKEDFKPDSEELIKKKRYRNKLIFMWYLNLIILFLLLNNFTSHILEKITS
mgnify:FL=1